jgi:hypothetical protein
MDEIQTEPAAPVAEERCADCRFYRLPPTGAERAIGMVRGTCRRFPAALQKLPDEWCGEYQRVNA